MTPRFLVLCALLGGLATTVALIRRRKLAAATEDFERRYGPA